MNLSIDDAKGTINEKKLENEHADGEIRVIREKISSEGVITSEINGQIEKTQSRINELNEKKKSYEEAKKLIHDELKNKEKLSSEIDKERIEAEDQELQVSAKIEAAKSDIIEFINEGGNLKEKIARYDTMLENIKLRKSELNSRYHFRRIEVSFLSVKQSFVMYLINQVRLRMIFRSIVRK